MFSDSFKSKKLFIGLLSVVLLFPSVSALFGDDANYYIVQGSSGSSSFVYANYFNQYLNTSSSPYFKELFVDDVSYYGKDTFGGFGFSTYMKMYEPSPTSFYIDWRLADSINDGASVMTPYIRFTAGALTINDGWGHLGTWEEALVDTNTNAQTMCANGEYLDGSGTCYAVSTITPDTSAVTICGDTSYLLGNGDCTTALQITSIGISELNNITNPIILAENVTTEKIDITDKLIIGGGCISNNGTHWNFTANC